MLPILKGTIKRRLLVNFRADPEVAQRQLPAPLKVLEHKGSAIVGICLIRLEHIRVKGFPRVLGLTSENMAHRIAVTYGDSADQPREGVYIWRRDSNQLLNQLAGGRLFPGLHSPADFTVFDEGTTIELKAQTQGHTTDAHVKGADLSPHDFSSQAFSNFEEARGFFSRGSCGFNCSVDGKRLEGMELVTKEWLASPVQMSMTDSAFYGDKSKWPEDSVQFDSAMIMRDIEHEWHEINSALVPATTGGID